MALRRVTVPGGGKFAQDVQDGVSRLARDINDELIFHYGRPTPIIYSDYRPSFGDLVRLSPTDNAITVTLPRGSVDRIGKAITIANITTATNTVTFRPAEGNINGETSIVINKKYFVRQAVYLGADASGNDTWFVTVVSDGATAAGTVPFFSWNETDLSQFGSLLTGSGNAQSASVVSSAGLNWIQISGNCTGAADFSNTTSFLPVTSVSPPTANYIVMADCVVVLSNGNLATMGVGARHAANTGCGDGYFMGMVGLAGTTTGNVLMADIASTVATGLYSFTTSESLGDGDGYHFALGVEGNSHLSGFCGSSIVYPDTTGTYTAAGDFGIYAGGNNTGTNGYTLRFRNIRAYDWPNDGLFI